MNRSYRALRKMPLEERRTLIYESLTTPEDRQDFQITGEQSNLMELSDTMVEQAIGYLGIPLALAGPLKIDDISLMIPMATEEPSVVAAATFAGQITAHHGGFHTQATAPIMQTQIFLQHISQTPDHAIQTIQTEEPQLRLQAQPLLSGMTQRGGGWHSLQTRWLPESRALVVNIHVDVQDAQGANILNTLAEQLSPTLEQLTGGHTLMAIVSNRAAHRIAEAQCSLPVTALSNHSYSGTHIAERIVQASIVAQEDPDRAITHNKGIMNGISALALATANDTRAIEAAAHCYAHRSGTCAPLSHYTLENGVLHGSLKMPLPFATRGGSVQFHPGARWSQAILHHPDAPGLSRIAAALGLAQNLAALKALVSEGIQPGHMYLHSRRLAYSAGARGNQIPILAQILHQTGIHDIDQARIIYQDWKHE